MSFLGRMNGWQRLWSVTTVLAVISAGLIYPLAVISQGNPGQRAFREMLLKDLSEKKCKPYVTQPVGELREPPVSLYGMDCSALYLSRKAAGRDIRPYSIEIYDARESARGLQGLFPLMVVSGCLSLAASVLVYTFGLGVVWIRQRFSSLN